MVSVRIIQTHCPPWLNNKPRRFCLKNCTYQEIIDKLELLENDLVSLERYVDARLGKGQN